MTGLLENSRLNGLLFSGDLLETGGIHKCYFQWKSWKLRASTFPDIGKLNSKRESLILSLSYSIRVVWFKKRFWLLTNFDFFGQIITFWAFFGIVFVFYKCFDLFCMRKKFNFEIFSFLDKSDDSSLAVDLGISWIDRLTDFLYFLYCWKYQNMVLLSFEHFEKIRIFPKSGGRSSKIVPATPISILSF